MSAGESPFTQRVRAFFFGRDVFISYCYVDSAYAEALAVALQRLKFSVFLGGWGASPGEELSHEVSSAARHSRLLVVIATPASRASGPVEDEIRYFADRTRPVIPVDLGLDLRDTKRDWPALAGTDVIREPYGETKRPSRPVIKRIRNASTFTRQTARLKRFIASVFVIVASVTGGATIWSRSVVKEAQAKVAEAETRVAEAREGAAEANAKRVGADLLASAAGLKTFWATLRTRAVAQQAQFAESDRRAAAGNAEREAAIGSYIRMANDAAAMLDLQPARLGGAALQAVQAVRFLEKRGTRAPAADRILRQTLDLLPYVYERRSYRATHDWRVLSTPDGRWIADRVSDRTIAVINTETETRQEFSLPEGTRAERIALSDDGAALAVSYLTDEDCDDKPCQIVSVWTTTGGARRDVRLPRFVDPLAVSNGGTYLAARSSQSSRIAVVRVGDAAVVAATPSTRSVHELAFTQSGEVLAITGGTEESGMWAWRTDPEPVPLPKAALLLRHPTNEHIVAIAGLETLKVHDWKSGEDLWSAPREMNRLVRHAAFSPDGEYLAFVDVGQAYLVPWRKPESMSSFPLRAGSGDIVPTNQGAVIVSYGDGSVDWHDASASQARARAVHHAPILRILPQPNDTVRTVSTSGAMTWAPPYRRRVIGGGDRAAIAVSADGSQIATASRLTVPSDLMIDDEAKWTPSIRFDHDWTIVAFGPGKSFYIGLRDGRVLRWKAVTDVGKPGAEVVVAKAEGPVTALAIGPAGRVALASGRTIWLADGSRVKLLHRGNAEVTALAFGPSDEELAAGTVAGEVRLWQRGRTTTFTRKSRIESLAISADGHYLAATAHPQPAAIWRVDEPAVVHELRGDPANAITFHPTDGTIATGGQSGVVQVWSGWDQPRALEVARFSSGSFVEVLRFTDDGRYLIAVPKYGEGAKWVWKNAELIADACRRLWPVRNTGDVGGYDVICGAR